MSDVSNLGGFTKVVAAGAAQKVQVLDQTVSWVILQNDLDSLGDLLVGGAVPTLRLIPGQATNEICINQLSSIWVKREDDLVAGTLRVMFGA